MMLTFGHFALWDEYENVLTSNPRGDPWQAEFGPLHLSFSHDSLTKPSKQGPIYTLVYWNENRQFYCMTGWHLSFPS